jgi:2-polyprenyl-6-hydroxyphenyl methylase/3-demethylubiquinone-9 3-methyltransferase
MSAKRIATVQCPPSPASTGEPATDGPGSNPPSSQTPTSLDAREIRFAFGKNWSEFLTHFNSGRLGAAQRSLTEFLGMADLSGRTFLDIGCGSGLFSLAAHSLRASKVVSFDFDANSVSCAQSLRESAEAPGNWIVQQGSVLDREFLGSLGRFDVVYSWGVLHHTGDMWLAIRNAASLVAPNGLLCIALYNRTPKSEHWKRVKRFYCQSPKPVKLALEAYYVVKQRVLRNLLRGRNPFKVAFQNFGHERGMHWLADLRDWLGGYPYEFATVDEVFSFMKQEFPSSTLVNIKTEPGLGNNWFLYRNTAE